ncbi:hypothetical protein [Sedimenticola thiotaurini]|uniref:hypothetical protein n=1 Tax=Sedimenticola thiotaurini TaxID=1543721 RepID=UPI00190165FA|nr:hypothetical protein [Sedimenticola thiotaurini]
MARQFVRVILVIVLIFLVGCNGNDELPLYGSPTKIPPGETPIDVVCGIQKEFKILPKPLMQRMSYQSDWTSHRIGAAAVRHKGFYRVHLRQEALDFLQRHSRLELVASLTPLFIDPDVGGEAAVLLAGIPAGSDSMQGSITRTIAGHIEQSRYKSPDRPGSWYDNVDQRYHTVSSLYGLTNSTSRVHKKQIPEYPGSLEEAIVDLLDAFSHSPLVPLEGSYLHLPQPHNEALVERWISNHGVPTLKSKAQAFIDRYKGDFSGFAMLPLMPYPQSQLQSNELYMMWLLGLEKEYWPAILQLTSGAKLPNKARKQFRKAFVDMVYRSCQSIQEK